MTYKKKASKSRIHKKSSSSTKPKAKAIENVMEIFEDELSENTTSAEAPIICVHQFTEDSAREFAEALQMFEEDKDINRILVRVDSYGGEIYSALSMIEAIENCTKPIYTMCSGKAMSCGALLLSAGKKRYIGKYSTVMVHQVQGGTGGTTADVRNDSNEQVRLQNLYISILAKNCKKKQDEIKALIKENIGADIYLTPKQAQDFGLVDHIGIPKFRKSVAWHLTTDDDEEVEDDDN